MGPLMGPINGPQEGADSTYEEKYFVIYANILQESNFNVIFMKRNQIS